MTERIAREPAFQETNKQIRVPQGTIVTCPCCGAQIARLTKDLHMGDLLTASCLEGIQHPIKPGDEVKCEYCGTQWFLNGRLHTDQGWMP